MRVFHSSYRKKNPEARRTPLRGAKAELFEDIQTMLRGGARSNPDAPSNSSDTRLSEARQSLKTAKSKFEKAEDSDFVAAYNLLAAISETQRLLSREEARKLDILKNVAIAYIDKRYEGQDPAVLDENLRQAIQAQSQNTIKMTQAYINLYGGEVTPAQRSRIDKMIRESARGRKLSAAVATARSKRKKLGDPIEKFLEKRKFAAEEEKEEREARLKDDMATIRSTHFSEEMGRSTDEDEIARVAADIRLVRSGIGSKALSGLNLKELREVSDSLQLKSPKVKEPSGRSGKKELIYPEFRYGFDLKKAMKAADDEVRELDKYIKYEPLREDREKWRAAGEAVKAPLIKQRANLIVYPKSKIASEVGEISKVGEGVYARIYKEDAPKREEPYSSKIKEIRDDGGGNFMAYSIVSRTPGGAFIWKIADKRNRVLMAGRATTALAVTEKIKGGYGVTKSLLQSGSGWSGLNKNEKKWIQDNKPFILGSLADSFFSNTKIKDVGVSGDARKWFDQAKKKYDEKSIFRWEIFQTKKNKRVPLVTGYTRDADKAVSEIEKYLKKLYELFTPRDEKLVRKAVGPGSNEREASKAKDSLKTIFNARLRSHRIKEFEKRGGRSKTESESIMGGQLAEARKQFQEDMIGSYIELGSFKGAKGKAFRVYSIVSRLPGGDDLGNLFIWKIADNNQKVLMGGRAKTAATVSKKINNAYGIAKSLLQVGSGWNGLDKNEKKWMRDNKPVILNKLGESFFSNTKKEDLGSSGDMIEWFDKSRSAYGKLKGRVAGGYAPGYDQSDEGIQDRRLENMRPGEKVSIKGAKKITIDGDKKPYNLQVSKLGSGKFFVSVMVDGRRVGQRLRAKTAKDAVAAGHAMAGSFDGAGRVVEAAAEATSAPEPNPGKLTRLENSARRYFAKKNPPSSKLKRSPAQLGDIKEMVGQVAIPADPDEAFRYGVYNGIIRGIDTCGVQNYLKRRKIRKQYQDAILDAQRLEMERVAGLKGDPGRSRRRKRFSEYASQLASSKTASPEDSAPESDDDSDDEEGFNIEDFQIEFPDVEVDGE